MDDGRLLGRDGGIDDVAGKVLLVEDCDTYIDLAAERTASVAVPSNGVGAMRQSTTEHRMPTVAIDLETLTKAERRDLANAFLRAAWSATLPETRTLLLDLLMEGDAAVATETES